MRFFTSRWMVLAFAILLLSVRVLDSDYVKTLRYKTWDYFQIESPRANLSDMVAIVDITEQDLKEYGQWPWPRHIMAMLLSLIHI